MRGTLIKPNRSSSRIGASLRVRGTDHGTTALLRPAGVIPACAGNRARRRLRANAGPGHPCVCGEQCGWAKVHQRGSGSSLRVRGTVADNPSCHDLRRVIPACAGNRPSARISKSLRKGHPCVCGEQPVMGRDALVGLGSSLRVRGTDRIERVLRQQPRVIPACAGTGLRPYPHGGMHRVIPACAGNRSSSARTAEWNAGHPCVCGEQSTTPSRARCAPGSSLRVRGTTVEDLWRFCVLRVIPACAGNSRRRQPRRGSPTGHPCVCGEQA